jgi:hypothetical protein
MDGMFNRFVTLFATRRRDFVATPQILLLHPKQIRDGCCTRTFAPLKVRASAGNQNPAP